MGRQMRGSIQLQCCQLTGEQRNVQTQGRGSGRGKGKEGRKIVDGPSCEHESHWLSPIKDGAVVMHGSVKCSHAVEGGSER